jgi:hypothetical protein
LDVESLSDGVADVGGDDEAYECEELYGVSTVMAGDAQSVVVAGVDDAARAPDGDSRA